MKTFLLKLGLSLLLLVVGLPAATAQGTSSFGFGYAVQAPSGAWTFTVIDPDGGVDNIPLSISEGSSLVNIAASPNGQWLMLYSVTQSQSIIQLMNPLTGEVRLVDQGFLEDLSLSSAVFIPQWSPNSQYLAYNIISALGGVSDTRLYDLSTGAVSTAFAGFPLLSPYELAWSPDSTQLAIATTRCTSTDGIVACGASIQRVSIPSLEPLGWVNATDELGQACNLVWSPNGQYVAYFFSCDNNINFYHEIFVLDVQQSSVQQVTALTNPAPLVNTLPLNYNNYYSIEWSTDNQLLAGIVKAQGGSEINPASFLAGTFAYPVPSMSSIPLLTEVAREWARNPVTGILAYREDATQLDTANSLSVANRQTKIAVYQNNALTEMASASPGCDYRWSPDGAYLMYRDVSQQTSLGIICSISGALVMYQSATGSFTTYEIGGNALSAGWIALPEPPTPTPTNTATATETSTATLTPTATATLTATATPDCGYTIARGDVSGLQAAIRQANENGAGLDVVCLTAGTYIVNTPASRQNAFPLISTQIEIRTLNGTAYLIRSPFARPFRFFAVDPAGALTLRSMNLSAGLMLTGSGGAIYNLGILNVIDSMFYLNSAVLGGAIYSEGHLLLSNTSIRGNVAFSSGGAIYAAAGEVSMDESRIALNAAESGIITFRGTSLVVSDSVFYGNLTQDEGALYASEGSITITDSSFSDNDSRSGAALFIDGASAYLEQTLFLGNGARENGGAIYISSAPGSSLSGMYNTFSANRARNGGAVASYGQFSLLNSDFSGNRAAVRGGAVYSSNGISTNSVQNGCLVANTASIGRAIFSQTFNFNATGNWWGSVNGPSASRFGVGTMVNENVVVTPFLVQPPGSCGVSGS